MKKIIDANYFQEPALEIYLKSDKRNKVVYCDYACMEAYKGNALKNIYKSIEIVSRYPKQVIILKGTRAIVGMKLALKGIQKRFEDPVQTNHFKTFCGRVKSASEGDVQFVNQILENAKAANEHFDRLLADTELIVDGIELIGRTFENKKDLANLRKNPFLTDDFINKISRDILEITRYLYVKHPDVDGMPSSEMLRNSYIFRFAVCSYLLTLRWISDGGANSVRRDRLRNDSVDMNYIVYATDFDGLLTNDNKMKHIYLDTYYLLENVFTSR